MAGTGQSRCQWRLPSFLLIFVLLTGCSVFDGTEAAEPEPTHRTVRNTVAAVSVGTRLTVTATVVSVFTATSFVVRDADLPHQGLLVLGVAAPDLRPADLVTVDGDITLFTFAGLAARYRLTDATPYADFEGRKILSARDVRSWA